MNGIESQRRAYDRILKVSRTIADLDGAGRHRARARERSDSISDVRPVRLGLADRGTARGTSIGRKANSFESNQGGRCISKETRKLKHETNALNDS